MPSVVLRNATDTMAIQVRPSTNYAGATTMHVQSGLRLGYIHFARAAPLGAVITSAKLRLYYGSTWTGTATIRLQRIAQAWAVSRLNWNNGPALTGAAVDVSAPAGPPGTLLEFDVTAHMQAVSDGGAYHGFRISSLSATNRAIVSAQGTSAYRPTLEVEWTEAPGAPTTLAPSGNRAVSTNKPTLRFDYSDRLGDTSLAAVQVQISATADWATAWDSGEVAASTPELDLTTTTYPGLADLASTYWRVRVKDGAGLWSEWSDDEQFRRDDLGTVAITNPPAAVVSEPTPPFIWTFTGGVQRAWEVLVLDAADPSRVVADSGERTGTEVAWTPPANKLTGTGPYRLVVHVWDTVDRETTPGAPTYAEATRDFTITPDATVTGVTGLAVTQPANDRPRMVLSWTRATAPDRYVVRRDGVVVAEVLPEDALVSGTSYEYSDDLAQPWHEHTWQVQAIVNNAASPSSVVTGTPRQRGIWLLDEGRGLEVWLAGQEGGSWAIGEEASVFAPVGGRNVVRRVQARRGYEGTLAGPLVDAQGRTAAQHETDLMAMRAEPDRPVTVALGDLSILAILGDVTTYPLPQHVPPVRMAQFAFWQVLP